MPPVTPDAIAAGFADHGRGFAGDSGFINRCHALDDLAVARDHLARRDGDQITCLQIGRRDLLNLVLTVNGEGHSRGPKKETTLTIRLDSEGRSVLTRLAKRFRLGFAARFGKRLGEVGKQYRQEKPNVERDKVLPTHLAWVA